MKAQHARWTKIAATIGAGIGIFASIYGVWQSNRSANEQAAQEQAGRQQTYAAFKQRVDDQLAAQSSELNWLRGQEEADFKFALQACSKD